jgi:hypothetical protein
MKTKLSWFQIEEVVNNASGGGGGSNFGMIAYSKEDGRQGTAAAAAG